DQTDTIYTGLAEGKTFYEALESRCFEPDAPNFTPRISAEAVFGGDGTFRYRMSILKSADAEGTACNRFGFDYAPLPGLGHFIHTYMCDGNPLPTFSGEPERIAVPDDIDQLTDEIWNALDENNKISLYVRYTSLITGEYEDRLINKHTK
ncbi:MAG: inosine monophosphate cyclohydrolase, partial [Mogibacterium sp.]|nr:inosine monophosphate cyclohydrolase [Mogibacterium sp.]